jgi:23S rRNA (uracil1939-C5)-methyltransferase
MKTDALFELDITDLASDGRGVARHGQKAVFVKGALAGERVRARLLKPHRQYDDAVAVEVLRASDQRVTPPCAHAEVCSGCSLQHLDTAAQIAHKEKQLLDNLERIGKVVPARLLPALQRDTLGYRRKARLSVKYVDKKNAALVGFREDNGRYVADIARCETLDARVGDLIAPLKTLIGALHARREIAQIEVAAADRVVLVFRHLAPLQPDDLAALAAFGAAHAVDIVLQPGGLDSLTTLDGAPPVELRYQVAEGLWLRYRPLDFVQVNDSINRTMVAQALELLEVGSTDSVLELFCGLGNFTLPLAQRAARVVGVEGDAGLLERAARNARDAGLANIDYAAADLTQDHREAPWAEDRYTRLLLDPPRAGAEGALAYLPGSAVERIVYVSCHPATLARDAATLVARGFQLAAAGAMDMFPHTSHVESMALFVR